MSLVQQFLDIVAAHGSEVIFHRDDSMVPCPCRTPEGFRDPEWHVENPGEPFCNRAGMLTQPGSTTEILVKGFVQPIQSTRATRLSDEVIETIFGEIQQDDHLAILPVAWGGTYLNLYDWGSAVEDWIGYNGRRFQVINANLIPDPSDGNPEHHWEAGLRLVR